MISNRVPLNVAVREWLRDAPPGGLKELESLQGPIGLVIDWAGDIAGIGLGNIGGLVRKL